MLECLWTPLIEHAEPIARELLAMRGVFLSRLLYKTFNGYVLSQFKKLEGDLRTHGQIKWKHAMHLLRLLRAGTGIHLLRTGELEANLVTLNEGEFHLPHVAALLAAKRGGTEAETLGNDADAFAFHEAEFARLLALMEQAAEGSPLPELPRAREALNALLLRLRLG